MLANKLITFVILSYNNEKYIKKAIEAALNQDFHYYEIIVCDDASTDSSWEIINDIALNYLGPHRFNVYRNKVNLGLVGNINRAFELSCGDLILLAAGDDVSHSNRISVVYETWKTNNFKVHAICSSYFKINNRGNFIGSTVLKAKTHDRSLDFFNSGLKSFRGCTGSYSKECYEVFGPIESHSQIEDKVLAFRGWLLGGVSFVSNPLIDYRLHDESITFKTQMVTLRDYKRLNVIRLYNKRNLLDQFENDVKALSRHKYFNISEKKIPVILESLNKERVQVEKNILISSYSLFKRIIVFVTNFREERFPTKYLFLEWNWFKARVKLFVAKKI